MKVSRPDACPTEGDLRKFLDDKIQSSDHSTARVGDIKVAKYNRGVHCNRLRQAIVWLCGTHEDQERAADALVSRAKEKALKLRPYGQSLQVWRIGTTDRGGIRDGPEIPHTAKELHLGLLRTAAHGGDPSLTFHMHWKARATSVEFSPTKRRISINFWGSECGSGERLHRVEIPFRAIASTIRVGGPNLTVILRLRDAPLLFRNAGPAGANSLVQTALSLGEVFGSEDQSIRYLEDSFQVALSLPEILGSGCEPMHDSKDPLATTAKLPMIRRLDSCPKQRPEGEDLHEYDRCVDPTECRAFERCAAIGVAMGQGAEDAFFRELNGVKMAAFARPHAKEVSVECRTDSPIPHVGCPDPERCTDQTCLAAQQLPFELRYEVRVLRSLQPHQPFWHRCIHNKPLSPAQDENTGNHSIRDTSHGCSSSISSAHSP